MPAVQFSGLASGIDGQAITEAMIEAKRLASIPLENKVKSNEAESEALEEFNTRMLTLSAQVKDFLTLSGGAVEKTGKSSNEDSVGVVASSDAPVATTTINVLNLARPASVSFDDRFAAIDQPIAPGLSGPATMSIAIGTGAEQLTVDVTIDATTTLSGLSRNITDALPGKVQASYINAGTAANPQYALLVQGVESGVELGTMTINVSGTGVLQSQNVRQAEDARINIDGIGQVVRAKNQISDLLPGISLDLKQAGTGPVTLTVASDASATAKKVADMVAAFNDLVAYSDENDRIERVESKKGATNDFGSLAKTRVDDQAIDSLRRALSSTTSSIPDSPVRVMADLGLSTQQDGTIAFDEQKFLVAIGKNSSAVEQLLGSFADRVGTTNGTIAQYTKFNGAIDLAVNSNKDENESINSRLRRIEENLERQREALTLLFSRLESRVSELNSQGSALTSALSGLSNKKS